MSSRVLILGANGMLGRYIVKYLLNQNYFVIPYTRKELDAINNRGKELANKTTHFKPDVVVNCIGLIKQRQNISPLEIIEVNSIFPLELSNICESINLPLIHITTDCVFDGEKGNYDELDSHTTKDIYGKSKSMGEPNNCTTIRTSIIGEEPLGKKLSLLEWVKSQCGKQCSGYLNHLWNGITCLQLAKIIEEMIDIEMYWSGIRHIFSPAPVSKFELIEMIDRAYNLEINIQAVNDKKKCDRTLKSNYDEVNFFEIPDIWEQVKEQKDFKLI